MDLEYYHPSVSELLTFGECGDIPFETDYIEKFGFTQEHIPDLIQMAIDPDLNWAYTDTLEVWAPIHAWRSLGQLRAAAAVKPLLSLMDELKESDWYGEELPTVLAQIGPVVLPDVIAHFSNPHYNIHQRVIMADTLQKIGTQYPEVRGQCVEVLTKKLAEFKRNSTEFNGWLVYALIDLKAVESAPVIEAGFAADAINPFVVGDWDDVQVELGLKTKEEISQKENNPSINFLQAFVEYSESHPDPPNSLGFGTGVAKNPAKSNQKKKKKKKGK